jgi:two-component system sensor histidine kinase KdpD
MNNLLNVTRLQAGASRVKLEPCDLSDVVGAALEELEASTRKSNISIDIPQDLPLVQMDFNLITQVLVNLFSNALKFSPAEQPIRLQSRIVGDTLEITVVDRGPGIPEEDLGWVFQSFTGLPNPVRSTASASDFPSAKTLWKRMVDESVWKIIPAVERSLDLFCRCTDHWRSF